MDVRLGRLTKKERKKEVDTNPRQTQVMQENPGEVIPLRSGQKQRQ